MTPAELRALLSAGTKGPLRLEQDSAWPFELRILDAQNKVVIRADRYAYSTGQKTLGDVRAAVGFKANEVEAVRAAIAKQEAELALIVAAVNSLEGLLDRVEALEAALSISTKGSLAWWVERAKMQAEDMDEEGILIDRDHWQQIVFTAQTQIARAALKESGHE